LNKTTKINKELLLKIQHRNKLGERLIQEDKYYGILTNRII